MAKKKKLNLDRMTPHIPYDPEHREYYLGGIRDASFYSGGSGTPLYGDIPLYKQLNLKKITRFHPKLVKRRLR